MTIRVLVVDDDHEAAESLAEAVRVIGHTAVVATCGDDAIAAAQLTRFDLALLDLSMPQMNGFELARALIVQCDSTPYLVAVTGRDSDADLQRSARAGFVEHVVKPCQLDALRSVIDRVTARAL